MRMRKKYSVEWSWDTVACYTGYEIFDTEEEMNAFVEDKMNYPCVYEIRKYITEVFERE